MTPRRKKPKAKDTISPWPADQRPPAQVASEVVYVGSPEHKAYVNPTLNEGPHPRSDKTQCEEYPAERWKEFTRLLQLAIQMQCTSDLFDDGGWPRYAWGWFEGRLFVARHRTDPPGNRYKGYLLEPDEYPEDHAGRLEALRKHLESGDV